MKNKLLTNKNLITLGKLLRNYRKLTVREASVISGVSFSTISKLERGIYSRPPIDMLERLAKLYNLDSNELDNLIILAGKIPPKVYFKIVENPFLLDVIRKIDT
jgi:transcriptional regulator with XRE-family HTH domain